MGRGIFFSYFCNYENLEISQTSRGFTKKKFLVIL